MKLIKYFLIFIVCYHVLHTVFLYGLGVGDPFMVSGLKDVAWIVIVLIGLVVGRTKIGVFFKQQKWAVMLFVLLVVRSVVLSRSQGIDLQTMIVGLKYDVYPLFILLSATFLGVVISGDKNEEYGGILRNTKIQWLFKLMGVVVIVGVIWQLLKIQVPELFDILGYGPVGDYVLGAHPPLYYRTGPGGMMRLQGLFSGPNNYGFFLVSFFSFFVMMRKERTEKKKVSGSHKSALALSVIGIFIISLLRTFSRGVLVGVGIQIVLLIWLFRKSWRTYLKRIILAGVVGMAGLTIWKRGSTVAHLSAWIEGRAAFVAHPWGYGLGSAGPAIHFGGIYLPENHYLQLLLDIGVPGLILWLGILVAIVFSNSEFRVPSSEFRVLKSDFEKRDIQKILRTLLLLGLVGLLIEGLFLHVFEDSMVNYLFLVVLGLVVGNVQEN